MAYQVVVTTDEGMVSTYPDSIEAWAEDNYAEIVGVETSPRRRAELQGHPKIRGFTGPAFNGWDANGEPIIRYEDAQTYADLSF
jgi:hypothetical protein